MAETVFTCSIESATGWKSIIRINKLNSGQLQTVVNDRSLPEPKESVTEAIRYGVDEVMS